MRDFFWGWPFPYLDNWMKQWWITWNCWVTIEKTTRKRKPNIDIIFLDVAWHFLGCCFNVLGKQHLPNWLVVSTHLKNISQNGNLLQIGEEHKQYLKPPPSKWWFFMVIYHGTIRSKKTPSILSSPFLRLGDPVVHPGSAYQTETQSKIGSWEFKVHPPPKK